MNRSAHAIAIALLLLLVVAGGSKQAPADERPFARLSGKDIRPKVIGKVVTDGAHWSDYFQKDGTLVSWSQGRRSDGRWEIRGEELCIMEEVGAGSSCYEVWIAGDAISLRLDGVETAFTGYLRTHNGP